MLEGDEVYHCRLLSPTVLALPVISSSNDIFCRNSAFSAPSCGEFLRERMNRSKTPRPRRVRIRAEIRSPSALPQARFQTNKS
jgi:hypothetical protein